MIIMRALATLVVAVATIFLLCSAPSPAAAEDVTYDGRSLLINGTRRLLFSGSIHYPRSTPQMWPSLISKAKAGGIDVIQTYVFWNVHEPVQGQYNFEGRNDLVAFIKQIQAHGLYCSLRIGPFIESEWRYGGFPFWLHDVPGIVFRSDNEPFKTHMQRFVSKIVNMMKAEGLYASQGGSIILSQVENEYQMVESAYRDKGPSYVKWAAGMAVRLQTGVPWMMCKQQDAPDPIINTCNGMNCGDTFQGPNSPTKPALWTENWTSFLQLYGMEPYIRSAEDIAYAVALFIAAKKGSFINYYMYHGGTNFGKGASSYVITSYYDQAPLDEYGLIRQPKWGHLQELHTAIKQCSRTLLSGTYSKFSLGQLQEAHVFEDYPGNCAAFVVNKDRRNSATVQFRNLTYELPGRSISILSDCRNVIFNTAKVSTQYGQRTTSVAQNFNSLQRWRAFKDKVSYFGNATFRSNSLIEQMGAIKDVTDYLWYTTSFELTPGNDQIVLHVESRAHVVHAFVNNMYLGYSYGRPGGPNIVFEKAISLRDGKNDISLLSVMVGLPDSGAHLEHRISGLRKVTVQSGKNNPQDISNHLWGYQVGLLGEKLKVYTEEGSKHVAWESIGDPTHQPLTWYMTIFDAPSGDSPVVLNLQSMGKGEAWINGESIGRYWVSFTTPSGKPSQSLYHIPRSFLKQTGNLLVLFEEMGGDPSLVSLETVSVTDICGVVSESHPPSALSKYNQPSVRLQCPGGRSISSIKFASFGTPTGDCQSYAIGSCHATSSRDVVEKACLGKGGCDVLVVPNQFGEDPCWGTVKSLKVVASCH